MDKAVLAKLVLKGDPLRFQCPPQDAPSISDLLFQWQTYLKATGVAEAVDFDRSADIHRQIVQFLRSIDMAGRSDARHPVARKCREHFDYFVEKSDEHGTDLSHWEPGVIFAKPSSDAQRVMSEVVQEAIGHLLNLADIRAATAAGRPAVPVSSNNGPVTFIASEDDSRKTRGYHYYGDELAMVETHFDAHLLLDLCDLSLTPTILKTGWWEPWIDILLRSTLRPGMTYVNAGANVGYHTVLGGKLVESHGKVFSFEANPHAYSLLKKSVYFNGFSGRTALFAAAVSDQLGRMSFYYVREMLGGGRLQVPGADGKSDGLHPLRERYRYQTSDYKTVTVPVVTIDEAVAPEAKTIDFLHMDIEGSEGPALLGATELIRCSRQLQMILEWSFHGIEAESVRDKFKRAVALLVAEQFKIYLITPPHAHVYTTPPDLRRIEASDLFDLGHCDLYLTRL